MDDIKVSVCMVTYNHERYIAQAVNSVLAQQTKFPIEIVIGEDCSTDNTREILLEIAGQHPHIIRPRLAAHNQGAKANFLGTIAACRGDYVAMLEGDDYWTCPDKLQMQADALDARPDWAICFHPTACEYEAGLQGQAVYPLNWTRPEATILDLLAANFIPTGSVLFRNRLFGEFPKWFRKLKLGDWPLHILNAAHGNIGFLPEVMSAYRIHRGGIWTGETPVARMSAIFQMFTAIDHHFAGKYAAEIDRYRLNAVRELWIELDTLKTKVSDALDRLRKVKTGESLEDERTDKEVLTVQNFWNQLSYEFITLENKYESLAIDHRRLKAFHDTWHNTISHRVARETRRPFQQLLRFLQRRRNNSALKRPPSDSSASKAA